MKKIKLDRNNPDFKKHFKKYNIFNFKKSINKKLDKPGKFFLYELLEAPDSGLVNKDISSINYPKLSIFLDYLPCDQTIEVECIDVKRTYEQNLNNYYTPSKINSYIIWDDYMLIYGVWDSYPNWKELKKAYQKTWWFRRTISEERNIKLNSILNEKK